MASLVLGTAQLGMKYGVANRNGQPDRRVVIEIIRAAWEGGIREFDTAQEYGSSEEVLGQAFRELKITNKVRVISKLAKDIDLEDGRAVIRAVKSSLTRLGVPKLFGLLLHKEELLDIWQKNIVGSSLREFVQHLGVSVYSPACALQALEMDGIDMVQIPTNILDQRFEKAGVFAQAKERHKTIYIRSVFLQGFLCIYPNGLPPHMEFAKEVLEQVSTLAHKLNVSPQVLAFQYVKTAFPRARILYGAETPAQVRENVTAWNTPAPAEIVKQVQERFQKVDENLLDPRKWPILRLQHYVTTQSPEKADAIIWLQGNMYDRGLKVLELFRAGYAPKIVVTGNNMRIIEEDNVYVRDVVRWLNEYGISKEAIMVDDQAMNTKDQAEHVIAMAVTHTWRRILLVGSIHHQLRAFLTFLKQAQLQGWDGRIINQPAKRGWDERVSGINQTVPEAFEEEIKKIYTYRDLASVEDGINYFR